MNPNSEVDFLEPQALMASLTVCFPLTCKLLSAGLISHGPWPSVQARQYNSADKSVVDVNRRQVIIGREFSSKHYVFSICSWHAPDLHELCGAARVFWRPQFPSTYPEWISSLPVIARCQGHSTR